MRHSLIVMGKRISCPPQYGPPNNDYDPPHHDCEHGFPLIRRPGSINPTINISIIFICAFLVDCGRIIRHPAIKNDSSAILSVGAFREPFELYRFATKACRPHEGTDYTVASSVCKPLGGPKISRMSIASRKLDFEPSKAAISLLESAALTVT